MEKRYGPEDIEQLLIQKEFQELYPEEKTSVLLHIADEEEYSSMREMLLIVSEEDEHPFLHPSMKYELLAVHEAQHKKRSFKVWLNSLFTGIIPNDNWLRPSLQLASIAALIVLGGFLFRSFEVGFKGDEVAQQIESKAESTLLEKAPKQEEVIHSTEDQNIDADLSANDLEPKLDNSEQERFKQDDEQKAEVILADDPIEMNESEEMTLEVEDDKPEDREINYADVDFAADAQVDEISETASAPVASFDIPEESVMGRTSSSVQMDIQSSEDEALLEEQVFKSDELSLAIINSLYTAW